MPGKEQPREEGGVGAPSECSKMRIAFVMMVLVSFSAVVARGATLGDISKQAQTFAAIGIKNADNSFSALRTDAFTQGPGQHFHTNVNIGDMVGNCHISGFAARVGNPEHWDLACVTPYIVADQASRVRAFLYRGVIQAMPACFQEVTDPAVLADEDYRWDCRENGHAYSVDITSLKADNGSVSFLLETYQYISDSNPTSAFVTPPIVVPKQRTINVQPPENGSKTLKLGRYEVNYKDYLELVLSVVLATTDKPSKLVPHAVAVPTAGNQMPAYAWNYHYAGRTGPPDAQVMNILVCTNLAPQGQLRAFEFGTLLGLLDAGKGGPVLQDAYKTALAADVALGPQAPDPFLNRHALIDTIGRYFAVDKEAQASSLAPF